jgi:hypothetical protein
MGRGQGQVSANQGFSILGPGRAGTKQVKLPPSNQVEFSQIELANQKRIIDLVARAAGGEQRAIQILAFEAQGGKLVTEANSIQWVNAAGEIHHENGPAVEYFDGTQSWYINGKLHREDGPAVIYADGATEWRRDGQRHREDGPALELSTGEQQWFYQGERHRADGPAIIRADGEEIWYWHDSQFNKESDWLAAKQHDETFGTAAS